MTSSGVIGLPSENSRGRVDVEGHVAALRVGLDRAGDQAVERERLVVAARHQAFDHVAADRRRSDTSDDEGIEAVEGAEHALHQAAALGRVRVGVGQAGEACRQRGLAMHRQRMSSFRRLSLGELGGDLGAEQRGAEQHGAPGRGSSGGTTEGKKRGHGDNATRRLEVMTSIPMNGAG